MFFEVGTHEQYDTKWAFCRVAWPNHVKHKEKRTLLNGFVSNGGRGATVRNSARKRTKNYVILHEKCDGVQGAIQ